MFVQCLVQWTPDLGVGIKIKCVCMCVFKVTKQVTCEGRSGALKSHSNNTVSFFINNLMHRMTFPSTNLFLSKKTFFLSFHQSLVVELAEFVYLNLF